jgi:hypothetical protein
MRSSYYSSQLSRIVTAIVAPKSFSMPVDDFEE